MRLPEDDIRLFYRLHPALLFYTNRELELVEGVSTFEELMRPERQPKCR